MWCFALSMYLLSRNTLALQECDTVAPFGRNATIGTQQLNATLHEVCIRHESASLKYSRLATMPVCRTW